METWEKSYTKEDIADAMACKDQFFYKYEDILNEPSVYDNGTPDFYIKTRAAFKKAFYKDGKNLILDDFSTTWCFERTEPLTFANSDARDWQTV